MMKQSSKITYLKALSLINSPHGDKLIRGGPATNILSPRNSFQMGSSSKLSSNIRLSNSFQMEVTSKVFSETRSRNSYEMGSSSKPSSEIRSRKSLHSDPAVIGEKKSEKMKFPRINNRHTSRNVMKVDENDSMNNLKQPKRKDMMMLMISSTSSSKKHPKRTTTKINKKKMKSLTMRNSKLSPGAHKNSVVQAISSARSKKSINLEKNTAVDFKVPGRKRTHSVTSGFSPRKKLKLSGMSPLKKDLEYSFTEKQMSSAVVDKPTTKHSKQLPARKKKAKAQSRNKMKESFHLEKLMTPLFSPRASRKNFTDDTLINSAKSSKKSKPRTLATGKQKPRIKKNIKKFVVTKQKGSGKLHHLSPATKKTFTWSFVSTDVASENSAHKPSLKPLAFDKYMSSLSTTKSSSSSLVQRKKKSASVKKKISRQSAIRHLKLQLTPVTKLDSGLSFTKREDRIEKKESGTLQKTLKNPVMSRRSLAQKTKLNSPKKVTEQSSAKLYFKKSSPKASRGKNLRHSLTSASAITKKNKKSSQKASSGINLSSTSAAIKKTSGKEKIINTKSHQHIDDSTFSDNFENETDVENFIDVEKSGKIWTTAQRKSHVLHGKGKTKKIAEKEIRRLASKKSVRSQFYAQKSLKTPTVSNKRKKISDEYKAKAMLLPDAPVAKKAKLSLEESVSFISPAKKRTHGCSTALKKIKSPVSTKKTSRTADSEKKALRSTAIKIKTTNPSTAKKKTLKPSVAENKVAESLVAGQNTLRSSPVKISAPSDVKKKTPKQSVAEKKTNRSSHVEMKISAPTILKKKFPKRSVAAKNSQRSSPVKIKSFTPSSLKKKIPKPSVAVKKTPKQSVAEKKINRSSPVEMKISTPTILKKKFSKRSVTAKNSQRSSVKIKTSTPSSLKRKIPKLSVAKKKTARFPVDEDNIKALSPATSKVTDQMPSNISTQEKKLTQINTSKEFIKSTRSIKSFPKNERNIVKSQNTKGIDTLTTKKTTRAAGKALSSKKRLKVPTKAGQKQFRKSSRNITPKRVNIEKSTASAARKIQKSLIDQLERYGTSPKRGQEVSFFSTPIRPHLSNFSNEALNLSFKKSKYISPPIRSHQRIQSLPKNTTTISSEYFTNAKFESQGTGSWETAESYSRISDIGLGVTKNITSLRSKSPEVSSSSYSGQRRKTSPHQKTVNLDHSAIKWDVKELSPSKSRVTTYSRQTMLSPLQEKMRTESFISDTSYTRRSQVVPSPSFERTSATSKSRNVTATSSSSQSNVEYSRHNTNIPTLSFSRSELGSLRHGRNAPSILSSAPSTLSGGYIGHDRSTSASHQIRTAASSVQNVKTESLDQSRRKTALDQPSFAVRHHTIAHHESSEPVKRSFITTSRESLKVADIEEKKEESDVDEEEEESNDDEAVPENEVSFNVSTSVNQGRHSQCIIS